MTWTIGNKSVQYIWNLTKTAFSIRPSHGISTSYEADGLLAINKFQADKRILRVQRDPLIKKVTHYETFKPQTNPRNPNMWESVVRFDNALAPYKDTSHYNKVLDRRIYEPHVHDPFFPGGIRDAQLREIP